MTDDDAITNVIEQEFWRDDVVPFNRVDVATADGFVTLTGSVATLAARHYAEERASLVRGVRGIINRIDVVPSRVPAEPLAQAVLAALEADPATDAYNVDVTADDSGKVTITGTVDSHAERALVSTVTTTVRGVSEIDNRLEVDAPRGYGSIGELADHVRGRLHWDVRVDDSLIHVLPQEGGRITLSGTVGSLAEKSLAERLAWVDGVREVNAEHLNVEPWARDDDLQRGQREAITDRQVSEAVSQALRHDPRVVETSVEVAVDEGGVWLRGAVDNLVAKQAAGRDAENTLGVERVYNRLKVHPEVLTDAAVAQLIQDGLRGAGLLDGNEIDVTVENGEARLTGDVGSTRAYWRALREASLARGVEDLANDLTIRGREPMMEAYRYGDAPQLVQRPRLSRGEQKTDRQIYDDVASELFWSPFVDADDVSIEVDDGIVTLTGEVGSKRARKAARDNALEGGALFVRNELTVMN